MTRFSRPTLLAFSAAMVFLAATAQAVYFPGITYGTPQTISPGTTYRHAYDTSVPWQIDIIEVDLNNSNVELVPVLRQGTSCELTSSMASRSNGIAAINAGYFDGATGNSYSHVEVDGQISFYNVSTRPARSTFGLWGNHNAMLVQDPVDSTNTPVPPDSNWNSVIDAIGGGPNLVTAGAVDVRDVEEGFDAASGIDPDNRNPRTALGWNTTTNHVFLVTIDGRQSQWSVGMTCTEEAQLLIDLGCDRGMNYDGGGSTTCWVNGSVVNRPSDAGGERAVGSAWVVVPSFTIDNTDTECAFIGTWGVSANAGFYNTNSRYHIGNAGADTATFTPDLAEAGQYEVSAWWVAASNRASAAPFTVNYSGGSATVYKDQRTNGTQWVALGTYDFQAGTGGSVVLSDNVLATEYVSADAVKFVYLGPIVTPTPSPSPSPTLTPSPSPTPAPQTVYPSSYSVSQGTYSSGNMASLTANDNNYFVVASTTSGTRYATTDFTATGIAAASPTQIVLTVISKSSTSNTTQNLSLWNYTTSAWDQKDSITNLGTSEQTRTVTVTTGAADYVSAGSLKVRVSGSKSKNFNLSHEQIKIDVTP